MGVSSLVLAVFLVDCLFYDNINAVVISHEKGATQRLFQRVKFYIDHLPIGAKVKLDTESKNEFYFADTGSRFFIGTAGAKAFGHGETIQRLHISELSRWENPSLLMGLLQAVPKSENSWVVIESTANGTGNDYYQRWMSSKNRDNPYTGHFYPWTMFEEYRTSPPADFSPLPEEQELMKQGLSLSQMVWRREKIEEFTRDERGIDPVDFFKEQYPLNEVEAFVSTSTTAFNLISLREYGIKDEKGQISYEEGRRGKLYSTGGGMGFEPDSAGWLTIYKKPELGKKYSIGADVASGSERGNYSAAVVICFPGTTKIDVQGGDRMIRDMRVGDIVRTHTGKWQRVKRVFRHRYSHGTVLRLITDYGNLVATPEHPILVNGKWKVAKDIEVGDKFSFPFSVTDDVVKFNNIRRTNRKQIRDVRIDVELARWLGLYVAEGSARNGSTITFTFNDNESDYIDFTKRIGERFIGKPVIDNHARSATNIIFNSVAVHDKFVEMFGTKAVSKKIPSNIFKWGEREKAAFLLGLLDGDGAYHTSGACSFGVASQQLRDDTVRLLSSLSITVGAIADYANKGTYGREDSRIYRVYVPKSGVAKLRAMSQNSYLVRLILTQCNPDHNGYVYNLEVEKDNSYIANGFSVHNCNDNLEQVAEFRAKVDTDVFAEELIKLSKYYNQAFLGVESNNQGLAVLLAVQKGYNNLYFRQSFDGGRSVPKLGWETNSKTRPLMIDYMASLIREHQAILHSENLISECMSFVKNSKGRYGAAEGAHDDLVMASAIAFQMYHHKPVTGESESERTKKKERQLKERRRYRNNRDPFASVYV